MHSSSDVLARLCASVFCLGVWGALAAGSGWLAHRRVRSVEGATGRPARPDGEGPLLWYAGAAVAWPFAAGLALVGLISRERARVGRNCFYLLLGHFTLATVGAIAIAVVRPDDLGSTEIYGAVYFACGLVASGVLAAAGFGWIWAGRRARRIASEPPSGAPPEGWVRVLLYLGSAVFWPAGLVSAAVFTKPESAAVGATAFRVSLLHLVTVAIAVCVGIPIVIAHAT